MHIAINYFCYICIQKVDWYFMNMYLFMYSNGGSSKNHPQPDLMILQLFGSNCSILMLFSVYLFRWHTEDLKALWLSQGVALQNMCPFLRSYFFMWPK